MPIEILRDCFWKLLNCKVFELLSTKFVTTSFIFVQNQKYRPFFETYFNFLLDACFPDTILRFDGY